MEYELIQKKKFSKFFQIIPSFSLQVKNNKSLIKKFIVLIFLLLIFLFWHQIEMFYLHECVCVLLGSLSEGIE